MTSNSKQAIMFPASLMKKQKMEDAKWEKTTREVYWFGKILPIGTLFKSFETRDHGYVVLESPVSGRKIYQY